MYAIPYNFERVDIFLRVKGRLPNQDGDSISQEILDDYCRMFENDELTQGMVPLDYMYRLIRDGKILTSEQLKVRLESDNEKA